MGAIDDWVAIGGTSGVVAGGGALVAWFRWWGRRRERRRLALALLFGDKELGVPALQPWRKDVDRKLDLQGQQLAAILSEHHPNGGSSTWDGLVAVDKNIRAVADRLSIDLPDQRPLAHRAKPPFQTTPVPSED